DDRQGFLPVQPAHVRLVLPVQGLRRLVLPAQPCLHSHPGHRHAHPRRTGALLPADRVVLIHSERRAPRTYRGRRLVSISRALNGWAANDPDTSPTRLRVNRGGIHSLARRDLPVKRRPLSHPLPIQLANGGAAQGRTRTRLDLTAFRV